MVCAAAVSSIKTSGLEKDQTYVYYVSVSISKLDSVANNFQKIQIPKKYSSIVDSFFCDFAFRRKKSVIRKAILLNIYSGLLGRYSSYRKKTIDSHQVEKLQIIQSVENWPIYHWLRGYIQILRL